MKFLTNVWQMIIYHYQGIFFLQNCNFMQFLAKNYHFFAKKSASNFFGPQLGKTKLIFIFYTFFKTSMQKIRDGYFF